VFFYKNNKNRFLHLWVWVWSDTRRD